MHIDDVGACCQFEIWVIFFSFLRRALNTLSISLNGVLFRILQLRGAGITIIRSISRSAVGPRVEEARDISSFLTSTRCNGKESVDHTC